MCVRLKFCYLYDFFGCFTSHILPTFICAQHLRNRPSWRILVHNNDYIVNTVFLRDKSPVLLTIPVHKASSTFYLVPISLVLHSFLRSGMARVDLRTLTLAVMHCLTSDKRFIVDTAAEVCLQRMTKWMMRTTL